MKRMFPTLRAAAACLVLAGAASAAGAVAPSDDPLAALQAAYARAVVPGESADRYRDLFASVLQRVQRSHASEVDTAAFAAAALKVLEPLPAGTGDAAGVFKQAVNEALRGLDPHSRYLDPPSHAVARGDSTGSFVGLGIEIEPSAGAIRVVAPIPGSPAARAGVQAGDLIVRIDDQPLHGLPLAEAVARMRGQVGTSVSLTIERKGASQALTLAVTRDTIRRQPLRWSLQGDVLVLRLASFSGPVTLQLEQAVTEATATAPPRAVVLDLRGNPGGLLREAVAFADAFLDHGDIVSLRGRTPASQRAWQADARQLLAGVPMVVLIDKRSASASELVADALQHHGRAIVMGQRSTGKGSVQTTYSLGDQKGALKLTTSYYHGPSGRTVQRTGVAPDIELAAAPPAAAAADAAGAAGTAAAAADPDPPAATEPLRLAKVRVEPGRCPAPPDVRDPGLACAVAYLLAASLDDFVSAVAESAP
jgi:carboxyl-terminal processing protease